MRIIYILSVIMSCVVYHYTMMAQNTLQPAPANGTRKFIVASKTLQQYGLNIDSLNEQNVEALAKVLFDENTKTLGFTSKNVRKQRVIHRQDWWTSDYEEVVNEIPVYRAIANFTIMASGTIELTKGDSFYDSITCNTSPKINFDSAVAIARTDFNAEPTKINKGPELIILPMEQGASTSFYLTWRILLFSINKFQSTQYFIDAHNGKVLWKEDMMRN